MEGRPGSRATRGSGCRRRGGSCARCATAYGRKADAAAGSAQVEAGWQTIAIGVAKGRWVAGENQIVIETGEGKGKGKGKGKGETDGRIAVAWMRIAKEP